MPARIMQPAMLALFTIFSMKGHETQVFNLLMKNPMTIKQLQKASHMSERMLRSYLDDLTERNFVSKKVIEGGRLKYVYYANSEMILNIAKDIIAKAEKRRSKMKKDIVHGTRVHTEWRR